MAVECVHLRSTEGIQSTRRRQLLVVAAGPGRQAALSSRERTDVLTPTQAASSAESRIAAAGIDPLGGVVAKVRTNVERKTTTAPKKRNFIRGRLNAPENRPHLHTTRFISFPYRR
jgi:hypothetical protein